MAVDLRKYEVDYPVVNSEKAENQADLLASVVQGLQGRGICAAALDAFIAIRNDEVTFGHSLAIEVPGEQFVDPLAVVESLRRAA